jgi:hypothetical protein
MVKHREAHGSAETIRREIHSSGIASNHIDVRAFEPGFQRTRELVVDLQRSEARHLPVEHVGGQTWPRTDLENVVTEVDRIEHPRDDPPLDSFRPLCARTHLEMLLVHACHSRG